MQQYIALTLLTDRATGATIAPYEAIGLDDERAAILLDLGYIARAEDLPKLGPELAPVVEAEAEAEPTVEPAPRKRRES